MSIIQFWESVKDVEVMEFLSVDEKECPRCQSSYDNWSLIPPITVESNELHKVRWLCRCGCMLEKEEINSEI